MRHTFWILGALATALISTSAGAAPWRNVTDSALRESTGGWTNKTDLADVDGDGRVDILFANGSAYNQPDEEQQSGVWRNTGNDDDGNPTFENISDAVLGDDVGFTRVFKGRDVNGDGHIDLLVGNTYETQSRLYLGLGNGRFEEHTELLPKVNASIGDLEVGDIDNDGDLDIVLADWGLDGPGTKLLDPFTAPGGKMLVWRNELNGSARKFVDATRSTMPADVLVAWAWELELVDVDADFDLDVMASSKVGKGSALFRNDGTRFVHDEAALPAFTNNYDFEPMFLRLPGEDRSRMAVVTINDGEQVAPDNQFDLREHIFVTDDRGNFRDATDELWPDEHNAGRDDNMVVTLDFDSDGDPDFLIGALGAEADRLHVNDIDDTGGFRLVERTGLDDTPGTLGIELADLNGDGKLDVVQSQGELADPEQVWVGDEIAADTAEPIIEAVRTLDGEIVQARIHDNKSPSRVHDWKSVAVKWTIDGEAQADVAMRWTGEFYWRAELLGEGEIAFQVCAVDAAGNGTCGDMQSMEQEKADDVDVEAPELDGEGCGCHMRAGAPGWGMLLLVLGMGVARRRRFS
jgi:MYXO-CTERM domain-containing protein